MTFKTLIQKYACFAGNEFCKAHGYDLKTVLSKKAAVTYTPENYDGADGAVARGIRSTVLNMLNTRWQKAITKTQRRRGHIPFSERVELYKAAISPAEVTIHAYADGEHDRRDAATVRKMLSTIGVPI